MGRRERREEKRKRRRTIMSLFFVFLMVFGFSIAGVFLRGPNTSGNGGGQSTPQDLNYGDYEFEVKQNYYVAEINGREREFLFFPTDIQGIEIPQEAMQALENNQVLTLTFNPNSSDVQSAELARYRMNTNMDQTIYAGITQNSSQYNYPIITCQNATPSSPVIYLNTSNRTSINYDEGCVSVNGRSVNLLRATERLMYGLLGVI